MRYLLDTCVISDFTKEEPGTQIRLKQTPPAEIAVSSITIMELNYGLLLNPRRAAKIEGALASLISSITILPFNRAEAKRAAQIRTMLKKQGQPIGPYDFLIAATALSHGLIMVTANEREFARVDGLQLENWRQV